MVDTGVILRALMNPLSSFGQLIRRSEEFELLTSADTDGDLSGALAQKRLQLRLRRFLGTNEHRLVSEALARAEVIDDPPSVQVCRDIDDDAFFACAVAGRADYIVSEDEDILAIGEYEGVRTIRTAAFLALLDERSR